MSTKAYPSLREIYYLLNRWKDAFPEQVTLFTVGESEKYENPIPMIRIGRNKPIRYKLLLIGGIHGDEAIGVKATLYIIHKILRSAEIDQQLLQNVQLDIIPVLNVDGYNDNSRVNGNGVNINRNFPFGQEVKNLQIETRAIMKLTEIVKYNLSIFFHSANEPKYENVIRVPIEYHRIGLKYFSPEFKKSVLSFLDVILKSLNYKNISHSWEIHSDYVNVAGIGSDWIMAPLLKSDSIKIFYQSHENPHFSFNIELCYPKQPIDTLKIKTEEQEAYRIIKTIIQNQNEIP
jgi:hypothetical protein